MFPRMLLCSSICSSDKSRKKKQHSIRSVERETDSCPPTNGVNFVYSFPFDRDPVVPLRSHSTNTKTSTLFGKAELKTKSKRDMATKVSNFSDLIQRVAASCLLHPLAAGRQGPGSHIGEKEGVSEYGSDEYEQREEGEVEGEDEEEVEEERRLRAGKKSEMVPMERVVEVEMLMYEVFDSVALMKKAYVSLQVAHSPWDPERMRVADVAVVGELRKLGVLRERFRRCVSVGDFGGGKRRGGRNGGGGGGGAGLLQEVLAPYEAAAAELKKELKARTVEVENLKDKLHSVACLSSGGSGGKKGRSQSKRKVSCSHVAQIAVAPAPELFEATMGQVKDKAKSFTSLLLSLMRNAHWDIAAAVRSIEAATATTDNITITTTAIASTIATHHAKYALESYISRKIFQGFDHETFYMDGSLSSLLNPNQFRQDCFTQFRDMKAMDPVELLGILPTCHFGRFCCKKYLAIIHPKMEESLFGNLEQRQQVLGGGHPRSQFYGEFLGFAKAVWLLHLLAFSLDPAPSQFEASRGAEFHRQYMESVVKFSSSQIPAGQIVGFPVTPGFKLGDGSVIKARVYLVPRT